MLARYVEQLAGVHSRSVHTIRNYEHDLTAFFRFLAAAGREFDRAGRLDGRAFLAGLRDGGTADASIKRHATVIHGFYKWMDREGLLPPARPGDSILRLRYPKAPQLLPHYLSTEDATQLLATPESKRPSGASPSPTTASIEERSPSDLRDHAILELLYAAGLRVSEAAGIDTRDLDLVNQQVVVTGKGDKSRVALFGVPRSGRARHVHQVGPTSPRPAPRRPCSSIAPVAASTARSIQGSCGARASRGACARGSTPTSSATASPPTWSNRERTFASSSTCSATPPSTRRRSTRRSRPRAASRSSRPPSAKRARSRRGVAAPSVAVRRPMTNGPEHAAGHPLGVAPIPTRTDGVTVYTRRRARGRAGNGERACASWSSTART
ncbi:MAG: site-specific integrase [Dehalococcoidia bacterium]